MSILASPRSESHLIFTCYEVTNIRWGVNIAVFFLFNLLYIHPSPSCDPFIASIQLQWTQHADEVVVHQLLKHDNHSTLDSQLPHYQDELISSDQRALSLTVRICPHRPKSKRSIQHFAIVYPNRKRTRYMPSAASIPAALAAFGHVITGPPFTSHFNVPSTRSLVQF